MHRSRALPPSKVAYNSWTKEMVLRFTTTTKIGQLSPICCCSLGTSKPLEAPDSLSPAAALPHRPLRPTGKPFVLDSSSLCTPSTQAAGGGARAAGCGPGPARVTRGCTRPRQPDSEARTRRAPAARTDCDRAATIMMNLNYIHQLKLPPATANLKALFPSQ